MRSIKGPALRSFLTFEHNVDLTDMSGNVFGYCITYYEVSYRRDVKNLDSYIGYIVSMRQRVFIYPVSQYECGPNEDNYYSRYPAILKNVVTIKANNGAAIELKKVFPRTLNSQVSTSTTDGESSNSTNESSSGSTTSNVNTFGVSGSPGGGVGGLNLDYSHSWEHSATTSKAHSNTTGQSDDSSASMSIKDWSSYGFVGPDNAYSPTWIWGQSYPWDAIQNNYSDGEKDGDGNLLIDIPDYVVNRLVDGDVVLPPSMLSLFGLDFTMHATWTVDFVNGVVEDETVTITNEISCYKASHGLDGESSSLYVTLDTSDLAQVDNFVPTGTYDDGSSIPLNLSEYALYPILNERTENGAGIGFTANPFTYPETLSADTIFKIVSPANNLQVTGSGFGPGMVSDFSKPTVLTIKFKIADTQTEYALLFLHWIGEHSDSVKLNWTINNQSSGEVNDEWSGTILVSETEGNSGQNNVSSLELRNSDYTSINFHDYLVIGMNTITIEVDGGDGDSYTLSALAVGQA